jgi:hypothetical protein
MPPAPKDRLVGHGRNRRPTTRARKLVHSELDTNHRGLHASRQVGTHRGRTQTAKTGAASAAYQRHTQRPKTSERTKRKCMASTPGKRRSRFTRERRPDLPLELQERDRLILKALHEHRFLTSDLIRHLIPTQPTPQHLRHALTTRLAAQGRVLGDEPKRAGAALLTRLQRLYAHRFVDRVKISNNDPIAYALDARGIDELVIHYGIDRTALDLRRKNREAGGQFVAHTLMLARFRIGLERALEATPIRLARWFPEGAVLRDEVMFMEERWDRQGEPVMVEQRVPINPDAFAILDHPGSQSFYFVECDRSNHTRWRFALRLQGYAHYFRQGKCEEKFGVTRMPRILTITKSAARRDNLCDVAMQVVAKERDPDAGWLYWFASEKDYDVANPATLMDGIWRVPVDEQFHQLFE